jgi:Protein of unknown function (DUF1571)
MAPRVVVGLLSLTVGIATSISPIGCTLVGPRRFSGSQQHGSPQTVPQQPATSPPPASPPPASPSAVAPTEQPSMGPITRVSVPPSGAPLDGSAPVATPASGNSPRQLYQRAAEVYAGIDSYTARLRRREQVGGKDMPEELILAQFRKKPFSVHFKWIACEAQGRELIYVQGQFEDKIHTLLAPSDPKFFSRVMALPADSALVRSRSRYPITDAGLGNLIARFGHVLDVAEKTGPTMPVKSLGLVKRPESAEMLQGVEVTYPPRVDPLLPDGCRRWWFFDPQNGLPVLVITTDPAGREVEYYCYDRLLYPVKLDNADFDPTRLGKEK